MGPDGERKIRITTPEGRALVGVLSLRPPRPGRRKRDLFLVLHGIFGHKDYLMLPQMAAKLPVSALRYDCQGCGESDGVDRNYGGYYDDLVDIRFIVDLFERPEAHRTSSGFPVRVVEHDGHLSPADDLLSLGFEVTGMIGHSKGAHIIFMHLGSIFNTSILANLPAAPPSRDGKVSARLHDTPRTTNVKYLVDLSTRYDMETLRERYDSRWAEAEKEGVFTVEVPPFHYIPGKGIMEKGREKELVYMVDLVEFMKIPMGGLARSIPPSVATLITHCKGDTLTPPWHSVEGFHRAIPHSDLILLDGGDHNYSRPKELSTRIVDEICSWINNGMAKEGSPAKM
ncbi:Alpha/Beta hydrolase protein [Hyaloraphidium curvatum]|nr:Alpha/Beta hydrolase protein [Hyaloraphidium curvatum]